MLTVQAARANGKTHANKLKLVGVLVLHARDAAHQAAHWAKCTIVVNFVVTLCCVFLLLRVVFLLNSDNKSERARRKQKQRLSETTQTHVGRPWAHYNRLALRRAKCRSQQASNTS